MTKKSAEEIGRAIAEEMLAKEVEKRTYYRVVKDHASCPARKPYGVIGEKSGKLHGCHPTVAAANDQLSSLYASTDPNNGYKPSPQDKKNLESPSQHKKRRDEEKKKDNE